MSQQEPSLEGFMAIGTLTIAVAVLQAYRALARAAGLPDILGTESGPPWVPDGVTVKRVIPADVGSSPTARLDRLPGHPYRGDVVSVRAANPADIGCHEASVPRELLPPDVDAWELAYRDQPRLWWS